MKRYLIRTFGCQMNEHDSEVIAGALEADGMESATALDDADVVVLNTCCIRENADNKLYGALGQLKQVKDQRPDLRIAVGGCLAQKDRERVQERAGHVDVVFGTHNVARAAELIRRADQTGQQVFEVVDSEPDGVDEQFGSALVPKRQGGHAAWVTIQVGCDCACAYCIVPSVRGPEVSRSFGDLVAEIGRLAERGVTEVTLLGQNVNSYGRDLTTDLRRAEPGPGDRHRVGQRWTDEPSRRARPLFADLLREAGAVAGIRRVRFTSPHPKDLRSDMLAAMSETAAVCEHLHLPLQSGSDRVLAAMHRGYTAERYLERARRARELVDDLALSTDIIVGFPGETEDDFERTLEVVAEADYDSAFTFIFSPREGTEAAAATDRFVPADVCADRYARLRAVVERSARRRHDARIGRVEEIVVEGPSKKDPALLSGRTRQNKLVHFEPSGPSRAGTYASVEIVGAAAHHLSGRLVEILSVPTHRTHIPVTTA